jgi:hypothetical protein
VTLRWASTTPESTAARLAAALGLTVEDADGRPEIRLGTTVLQVVALPPGGMQDDRVEVDGPTGSSSDPGEAPVACVGVGVATVDTERFAAQRGWRTAGLVPDRVLGASASVVVGGTAGDLRFVVLEPSTEGRVAASLARWGEVPVALYLRAAAGLEAARRRAVSSGLRVSSNAMGPFGRSFAMSGDAAWGPHVVIVESAVPALVGPTGEPA